MCAEMIGIYWGVLNIEKLVVDSFSHKVIELAVASERLS